MTSQRTHLQFHPTWDSKMRRLGDCIVCAASAKAVGDWEAKSQLYERITTRRACISTR